MTSTDVPRIRITDPGDLIEAIPYLIGFHPTESLVLLGFTGDSSGPAATERVQVALRIDIPPEPLTPDDLDSLLCSLGRSGVRSVIAVFITEQLNPLNRTAGLLVDLVHAVTYAVAEANMSLLDVLLADDRSWWSLLCEDEDCCPPEGTTRQIGCASSAAQATVAGLVALPDRESMAASLAGDPASRRAKLEAGLARAEHRVNQAVLGNGLRRLRRTDAAAIVRSARQRSEGQQRRLTDAQLSRFGVALADISIRDDVWLLIDERSLDASELMYELHSRLPAPYDAAPMVLYGWSQWRNGNGTLAAMAAERALESDPGYTAAQLLIHIIQSGLDPQTIPTLRSAPDP
jgi:hypothetical protein